MTENEAIYCLKAESERHSEVCEECSLYGKTGCDHCYNDATDMAIQALEKQIPKEPLLRLCGDCQRGCTNCDRYVDRCPNCNGELYVETGKPDKYCPHCGQKLDWKD